jgi:hypothetical protein
VDVVRREIAMTVNPLTGNRRAHIKPAVLSEHPTRPAMNLLREIRKTNFQAHGIKGKNIQATGTLVKGARGLERL